MGWTQAGSDTSPTPPPPTPRPPRNAGRRIPAAPPLESAVRNSVFPAIRHPGSRFPPSPYPRFPDTPYRRLPGSGISGRVDPADTSSPPLSREERRRATRRKVNNRRRSNWAQAVYDNARARSLKSGVPFDITVADITVPPVCPILGIPLFRAIGKDGGQDNSPSLDRIVPERGYVRGNIAVISWRANRMKSNGTAAEHRRIAEWIDSVIPPPVVAA